MNRSRLALAALAIILVGPAPSPASGDEPHRVRVAVKTEGPVTPEVVAAMFRPTRLAVK